MITLKDVHLHYSSAGFRETSFKSYLFKALKGNLSKVESVHALRGISLTIQKGERVGILGSNGSGKSTLLKAIAGLYPISSGICIAEGSIRSLFELSLGFEPEATGRENILYRGLLLGETPKTMKALTEEIIAFADIGKFIDYPIKTYSSGMFVRLAFAISTMIPGDILLLDEVIGAGDAAFTQKAVARIHELIQNAKILVLVSHDISALQAFCNRLILLKAGSVVFDGPMDEGLQYYMQNICKAN